MLAYTKKFGIETFKTHMQLNQASHKLAAWSHQLFRAELYLQQTLTFVCSLECIITS